VGGFTFGSLASLSLADLLRVEAATGKRPGHKAVINIFLAGGPPHQDLWDIKNEAPSEIRGEFKAIKTNVAGIQICEVFPKIAAMMDRFAVIRTVVGSDGDHDGYQCLSGWSRRAKNVTGGYPAIGPVLWKTRARSTGPSAGHRPRGADAAHGMVGARWPGLPRPGVCPVPSETR